MPSDFRLDFTERIVTTRIWGAITKDDLLSQSDAIKQLFENKTLDSTWAQIYDSSAVVSFDNIKADLVYLLAAKNPWPVGAFRVMIAPKSVVFGMTRMYQAISEEKGESIHVVQSEAEAHAWLSEMRSMAGCTTQR